MLVLTVLFSLLFLIHDMCIIKHSDIGSNTNTHVCGTIYWNFSGNIPQYVTILPTGFLFIRFVLLSSYIFLFYEIYFCCLVTISSIGNKIFSFLMYVCRYKCIYIYMHIIHRKNYISKLKNFPAISKNWNFIFDFSLNISLFFHFQSIHFFHSIIQKHLY